MVAYSFKDPEFLWLLVFVPLFFLIAKRSLADISASKKIVITMLRAAAFTLLVLCLAGFSKTFENDELYVVYLLDVSHSNSQIDIRRAMRYMKEASDSMGRRDKAAVVVFGKEAVVEKPFSSRIGFFNVSSYVTKTHSNIGQAVKIAEVLFPEDVQKRIVLLTDGNETQGNLLREVKAAVSRGVEFLTLVPNEEKAPDFRVEKLILPENVSINEPFEVRVVVSGNEDGKAVARIMMDNSEIYSQELSINKGQKEVVTFQQELKKKGAHIFNVELIAPVDAHKQNNVSQGFVFVEGEPTVLYVYSGKERADELIKVLKGSNINVEVVTPDALHPSISYLRSYDSIILDNVPATSMSTHQMKAMQMYVKAVGGGLIMIGGGNSFGLGGYYKTPVEKALPV